MENVAPYLRRLNDATAALPTDRLAELSEALYRTYCNDKQVFVLGNGGSAATATHMAADIAKNTIGPNMRRFRALSLSDNTALLTALANDLGYENVFREQLQNLIRAGDLLIVISASGNSPNVLAAIRFARRQSALVAGLLGFDGGEAAGLVDIPIVVASDQYGIVEDVHMIVNHILIEHFQSRLEEERPWVV